MIFLCIYNKVTNRFVYYPVLEDAKSIAELSERLLVPTAPTASEFAEKAAEALCGDKIDSWYDDVPEEQDPWDQAKILRYRHYS